MAKLKCSKCERTFSMAAHLARHLNTTHGSGSRKPAKGKARRGPGRPPGRPAGTPGTAVSAGPGAGRVITEMRAYHGALTAQRASIESQISSIESALSSMGAGGGAAPTGARRGRPPGSGKKGKRLGRPPGRPAGRGLRAGSLKESIVKVLRQRKSAMTPRDIASAVRSSGYKSKAKDLTKAVSNALTGLKAVTKAGRGLYRA